MGRAVRGEGDRYQCLFHSFVLAVDVAAVVASSEKHTLHFKIWSLNRLVVENPDESSWRHANFGVYARVYKRSTGRCATKKAEAERLKQTTQGAYKSFLPDTVPSPWFSDFPSEQEVQALYRDERLCWFLTRLLRNRRKAAGERFRVVNDRWPNVVDPCPNELGAHAQVLSSAAAAKKLADRLKLDLPPRPAANSNRAQRRQHWQKLKKALRLYDGGPHQARARGQARKDG